jgi:thiol:disulfide interchange protein
MSRIAIAVPVGLIAFLAYVGLVLMVADHVLGWHWALQAPFFLVAGIAWAFPAKWLMFWAAGQR